MGTVKDDITKGLKDLEAQVADLESKLKAIDDAVTKRDDLKAIDLTKCEGDLNALFTTVRPHFINYYSGSYGQMLGPKKVQLKSAISNVKATDNEITSIEQKRT